MLSDLVKKYVWHEASGTRGICCIFVRTAHLEKEEVSYTRKRCYVVDSSRESISNKINIYQPHPTHRGNFVVVEAHPQLEFHVVAEDDIVVPVRLEAEEAAQVCPHLRVSTTASRRFARTEHLLVHS